MKVLVITRMKEMYYSFPPEVMLGMLKGSIEFIQRNRSSGKCKFIYNVPGKDMTVSIFEYDTPGEMDEMLNGYALSTFMDYELHILSDFDDSMKRTIDLLKELTAD